jgi:hypothetical protein
MASSTLDPDNMPEKDRQLGKGRGTRALGPSDTSDNGSDVQDSMRWTNEADIGLDKGTLDDPDSAARDRSAGPDIGDAWLDSDTDSGGSGEVAAAGRDPAIESGEDVRSDRVDYIDPADEPDPDAAAASAEDADEGLPSIPQADRDRAQRQQSRH